MTLIGQGPRLFIGLHWTEIAIESYISWLGISSTRSVFLVGKTKMTFIILEMNAEEQKDLLSATPILSRQTRTMFFSNWGPLLIFNLDKSVA